IGTGVVQLYAASQWNIPATEGYSTLLIEYEIIASQTFGEGIEEADIVVLPEDREVAQRTFNNLSPERLVTLEDSRQRERRVDNFPFWTCRVLA
ncbi:MAG: hypothetical protein AAFV98_21065, partial [Chloroflexota bacterium]